MNEAETIKTILDNTKTIAVIGLSDKPERPSYSVSKYMQQHGYRIVPINPEAKHAILGAEPYASLDAACSSRKIDLVDVFRASVFVPENCEGCHALEDPLPVAPGGRLPRRSSRVGRKRRCEGCHGSLHHERSRRQAVVCIGSF